VGLQEGWVVAACLQPATFSGLGTSEPYWWTTEEALWALATQAALGQVFYKIRLSNRSGVSVHGRVR